jgi:hypothetical protein
MSLADMTSKHLREIISSVPLPHPAQIARRRARTASAATGTKAARGRADLSIILSRQPASRWIKSRFD